MVDGLGGQNQFHKRDPPSHINNLAIPGRELPSAFVLEVLEIYSRKAPNRKQLAKLSKGEGRTGCQHATKHIIKINVIASHWTTEIFMKLVQITVTSLKLCSIATRF
jgi:hypothetical protein